mmetsp:Transcript_40615/g.85277  ORF Transcript_40615/g.85277 Transcript_40615/m.85277 type:complete len:651 (+) Transcript_40615:41-1993(+)
MEVGRALVNKSKLETMQLVASHIDNILGHARALGDQLEVPSIDEFVAAASTAIRDLRAASVSSWHLTYISFRPIFILLGILSSYLAIVLRVIAKHSVAHGWIAAREGYFQLRTATIWFIKFQRDLSTSAKYAELGAVAVAITLWLLRRHVKKYRYVERAAAWYKEKKRRALRKYQNFVDRVAKTSQFLALLLPHLLYVILVVATKRFIPQIVSYLATRTYLCTIISFWHPLYLTFTVSRKLTPHLKDYKKDEDEPTASEKTKGRIVRPTELKRQWRQEKELEELRDDVVDLLKYWVVYALLLAIVRTGKLLPFIGHILNVTTDESSATASKGFFGKKAASGLYSKLRLPGKIVEEITLVFFVWLRLMPVPTMGDEVKEKANVTNPFSSRSSPISKDVEKHRPVDILYGKLSPFALSAMNSSAFLAKKALGGSRNDESTVVSIVIHKLSLVLDGLVLVRVISKKSKEWLITTMIESSALLPAMSTLMMPSYFTNFGVIYVSLVVPAGYSTTSCNTVKWSSTKLEIMLPKMYDAARYLQFWIIHAAVTLLLGAFAPLLAWMPLSTHVTWLLWAYVQLESSTRKVYGWFESELGKESLDDSILMKSASRLLAALPSNVKDSSTSPVSGNNASSSSPANGNDSSTAEGDKSKVS